MCWDSSLPQSRKSDSRHESDGDHITTLPRTYGIDGHISTPGQPTVAVGKQDHNGRHEITSNWRHSAGTSRRKLRGKDDLPSQNMARAPSPESDLSTRACPILTDTSHCFSGSCNLGVSSRAVNAPATSMHKIQQRLDSHAKWLSLCILPYSPGCV